MRKCSTCQFFQPHPSQFATRMDPRDREREGMCCLLPIAVQVQPSHWRRQWKSQIESQQDNWQSKNPNACAVCDCQMCHLTGERPPVCHVCKEVHKNHGGTGGKIEGLAHL